MQAGNPETLPSDYYLSNFHSLAGFVQENYRDILTDAENNWYAQLCASPIAAQQLYIRLLTRKRSSFRLSKLNYPEIPVLTKASGALSDANLADCKPLACLQDLLAAYTKPEIIRLLALDVSASTSRVDLVESVLGSEPCICEEYVRKLQQADDWVTICDHQHWTVFTLCFFGNLYQSSTEFVLRDIGNVRYEAYPISPATRAFSCREQVDAHLRYFECEALFDTIDVRQQDQLIWLVGQLPELVSGDIHLKRRLDRLRNRVARQLERIGCGDKALELFAASSHPPARERQVRIHMKLGRLERAQAIASAMTHEPFNDAEGVVARRLMRKLNKEQGLKAPPRKQFRPDTTTLVLQPSTSRVELAARSFYSRQGCCFYTENALVSSVLGLFIWDIIFYPVKGVFFNAFQSAPADFYEADFIVQRSKILKSRFADLSDPCSFHDRVLLAYSEHRGKSNPLVRWGRISEELLSLALAHIPADHWQVMFNRLLQDPRDNTAGFPDLILFRDYSYEFIEIKGPGDTLQQNQRRWMQCFADHGIPCRVVNIRWGSHLSASTA